MRERERECETPGKQNKKHINLRTPPYLRVLRGDVGGVRARPVDADARERQRRVGTQRSAHRRRFWRLF